MGLYVCAVLVGVLLLATLAIAEDNQCLYGGGVNPALLQHEQQVARDRQGVIPCNVNDTDIEAFVQRVRTRMELLDVVGHVSHVGTFYNTIETCRSADKCPGSDSTWCIHLYHPTEDIQLCLNESGIVNETDYARLLQLQCYFSVPNRTSCDDYATNCIAVAQPDYMLRNAILTCHSRNSATNCTSGSYTTLKVEIIHEEDELPQPIFQNETSHLVLGETNLFLCTVFFTENTIGSFPSAGWFIDDVKVPIISEEPYCSQINGCTVDSIARTRDNRIRGYESIYGVSECPTIVLLHEEWLWIDNATEEDAHHSYRCSGLATYFNPTIRLVQGHFHINFTAVLPLLNITIIRVPHVDRLQNVTQDDGHVHMTFMQGESFQWPCAVTAGEGDQLQWLLNDSVVNSLSTTGSVPLECPHDELGSLYAVSLPVEDLGGYSRGFSTVLVACNLSFAESTGRYRCQLNRSRGDPVEVWSATVSIPSPTEPPSEAPSVSIGVYFGVASALLLLLILLIMVALCALRCHLRKRKRGAAMFKSAFAATQVTFVTEMGRSLDKEEELAKGISSQYFNDPLEFPREKLIVSDIVLGQGGFGQVIQARADGIIKNMPFRNVVAIKTCQENAPPHEISDLWDELQLMKGMKPHENIINLLGHCTTPSGPLYLIVEFAIHGSLKDYLHQCMEVVEKLNHTPRIIRLHRKRHPSLSSYSPGVQKEKAPLSQQSSVFSMTSQMSKTDTSSISPLITSSMNSPSELSYTGPMKTRSRCLTQDSGKGSLSSEPVHDYINCKGLIYMEDVMNFALQIACGLQHLEKLKVTHCDLAARNILIAEGFVLKIGDFGMARENSQGKRDVQGRIPVKWSAPEVIEHQLFTHQSDIWSYGVILWEILTYGQSPFRDQKISYSLDPFVKFLKDGNRLPCPDGCPSYIYDFMMCCWSLSPAKRPSANDLVDFLSKDDDDDDTQSLISEDSSIPTPFEVLAQSGSKTQV